MAKSGWVIRSLSSVGFTRWIGGVAVFNRALKADEMAKLAAMAKGAPIPTPPRASR